MKMPLTQYNFSSKAYRSTVFTGFSRLQKEEEFVDLTLAADGCFCKVHRSLIALASPYLRDILRNLQGNSPVIYLNKIRKEILEYILEYIYQGDVNIPVQFLEEFIEASKSLHIEGIADLEPPKVSPEPLKIISKKAKKRKLERVPNIEVSKPTDCTNLTQLSECDNIFNVHNNDNDDYCMEGQNKSSNDYELRNLNTKYDRESNKLVIVKNSNKDLITFHSRKEQHYPSIQIENVCSLQSSQESQPLIDEQPSEIPTGTPSDLIIDQSSKAQSYKIIVKSTKEQTEATENLPTIEIQPCPSQQENSIIHSLPNELAMLANNFPDHNIVKSSLPIFNILTNDNICNPSTDYITQSSQDSQPLTATIPDQNNGEKTKPVFEIIRNDIKSAETDYVTHSSQISQPRIETVALPDQNDERSSNPVFKISSNDIIKHAETEKDTPSLLQVSQPLIEIATIPDPDKEGKSKPVIGIIRNIIIKSAETDHVTQSSQISQPIIEIGSIPDHDNGGKHKPVLKILKNDESAAVKNDEAVYDTPAFQVSQPPILTTINLDQNNEDKSVPVIKILSNNEGAETDVGESSFKATLNDMKNMAQYSITERGALQLILNRFIYCCHGTSTKKQRWRCIDYRRGACPAIVDTGANGAIVYRKGIHGHQFHDKKIFQKHKRGLIFSTMALAIMGKDSKQKEVTEIVYIDEIDDGDL